MILEGWVPAIISSGAVTITGLAAGYFLKAAIEQGIQHGLDRELEKLKGDIRAKELQINALRTGALSKISARHEELDRRRIKSAENIWAATVRQRRFAVAIAFVSNLNVEEIAKASGHELEKMKEFGTFLWSTSTLDQVFEEKTSSPELDRLFLPPSVWAAYQSLSSISARAIAVLAAMKSGAGLTLLKDSAETNKMLKNVLPHQAPLVEKYPEAAMYYLVDELGEKIFRELLLSFEDADGDRKLVEQAHTIVGYAEAQIASKALEDIPDKFKLQQPVIP